MTVFFDITIVFVSAPPGSTYTSHNICEFIKENPDSTACKYKACVFQGRQRFF